MNSFLTETVAPGLPSFESDSRIIIGFSRLEDGSMSMNRGDETECRQRRETFFSKFDWKLERTVWGDLVHGSTVALVTEADAGRGAFTKRDAIPQTDGLWTITPNLLLCTTHADCIPLYFYIPKILAVGVAHCGWRGIADGLPQAMIQFAMEKFRTFDYDIHVGIGPGIRVECFEIGEDILDWFPGKTLLNREGKWFVDLPAVMKTQLENFGLNPSQIYDSGLCSKCTPLYSSFRRDKSSVSPAVAFIGIPEIAH